MLVLMPKRNRLIFDTTEEIAYAVGLRKLQNDSSTSDVVNEALTALLTNEIILARELLKKKAKKESGESDQAEPQHPKRNPKK